MSAVVEQPAEVRAFLAAIDALTQRAWPELVVTPEGHLRCPRCLAKDAVRELDYGHRENPAEVEVYPEGTNVSVDQGDRDFHTLAWQCTACLALVSMPEEVSIEW